MALFPFLSVLLKNSFSLSFVQKLSQFCSKSRKWYFQYSSIKKQQPQKKRTFFIDFLKSKNNRFHTYVEN